MSQTSKLLYSAALALCLGIVPAIVHAQARFDGWWVVLASIESPDNNYTPQVESEVDRIEAGARRCGLKPFHDFSSKFRRFSPGYTVVVLGAYPSRASAKRVLAKAKRCMAGSYIKEGFYAGE